METVLVRSKYVNLIMFKLNDSIDMVDKINDQWNYENECNKYNDVVLIF